MTAVSQRPIATWRSFTGTRSPITAMPTGKMPPARDAGDDARDQQHGEIGRKPAHQHGEDRDREARDHHAHLADHVADRAEHRLHQREGQREGGRRAARRRSDRRSMSCAIGGMIGSVAREASAVMKPIRLSRAIRPRAVPSSGGFLAFRLGFGATGRSRRRPACRNRIWAGNSWVRKAIHDFQRLCCAVRECLTRQSRGAGIARYSW